MAASRLTGKPSDRQAASSPHQVLFVLAGVWAIVVIAVTVSGSAPPSWHAREMIFGFGGAAFSGYALTAMKSWSADNRMSRWGVALLAALWLVARGSALGWPGCDSWLATAAGSAFLAAVAAILSRAAWRSGRGSALALLAVLLTTLQIEAEGGAAVSRASVLALALLLSVVGGRMVAAFTANAAGGSARHGPRHRLAQLLAVPAALAIGLALALAVMAPDGSRAGSALLVVAAIAEAARLVLWQSRAVWRNRLMTMLHLAFLWHPIGLALFGLSRWPGSWISSGDTLHALAAGAVSCSIYAVAARAVARRADGLQALPVDVAGFALLWLAAALRVFDPADPMLAPALLWCAAWAVFLARHGAALFRAPPKPVFSGPRKGSWAKPGGRRGRVVPPSMPRKRLHHQTPGSNT